MHNTHAVCLEGPPIVCLPSPTLFYTSIGSDPAGPTSSTPPELPAKGKLWRITHTLSSDLALIAKVWTENGRCEKIKCVSLTFAEGPAGSCPRFRNHFPAVASTRRDVLRENKSNRRGTSYVSPKTQLRDPMACWGGTDGCTAVTWHHQDHFLLSSLHFQQHQVSALCFQRVVLFMVMTRASAPQGLWLVLYAHVNIISIVSPVWKEFTTTSSL